MASADNVARGLKATIHNDRVSDAAKESAARRLEEMGAEVPSDYKPSSRTSASASMDVDPDLPTGGVGPNTVPTAGPDDSYDNDFISTNQRKGSKGTQENKEIQGAEYAEEVLAGETEEFEAAFTPSEAVEDDPMEAVEADDDGDYVPDDAEYIPEGDKPETRGQAAAPAEDGGRAEDRVTENRMLGGYKATLKNPNVSDKAKEHAREVLQEAGVRVSN